MGKKIIAVSVDYDIHNNFVDVVGKGNVSSSIQDYMQNFTASKDINIDGINLVLLKKEIENLTEKQQKNTLKLQKKANLLQKIEQKQQKQEINKLENEKKRVEEAKKCIECSNFILDLEKKHQFHKGFVCNSCFFASKSIKKWS